MRQVVSKKARFRWYDVQGERTVSPALARENNSPGWDCVCIEKPKKTKKKTKKNNSFS